MKVIIGHKKNWEFIRYDFEAEEQEDVATMEEESNAIRQSLQRLLPSYFQAMISAKTGLEAATVFYHFYCKVVWQHN